MEIIGGLFFVVEILMAAEGWQTKPYPCTCVQHSYHDNSYQGSLVCIIQVRGNSFTKLYRWRARDTLVLIGFWMYIKNSIVSVLIVIFKKI